LDGIIISCSEDPAVQELKKILKIPVVGAGHSAASLSINYGKKVGIIGIEKEAPLAYLKILKDSYLAYEKPKNINNTNDLRTKEGKIAVINSAKRLKNKGSDVITFACTGLSTVKAYELLEEISIPIVDGVIAEGTIILNMLIERSLRMK